MSIHEDVRTTCPNCGHEQTVRVWKSLNAGLDPEAKQDLLQHKINVMHCESCGASVPREYW